MQSLHCVAGTRGHSVPFQRDRHSKMTGLPTPHWEVRTSSHLPEGELSRCACEEESRVYTQLLGAGDGREWRKLGRHCPSSRTPTNAATHGAATHGTGAAHPEHVSLEVSTASRWQPLLHSAVPTDCPPSSGRWPQWGCNSE